MYFTCEYHGVNLIIEPLPSECLLWWKINIISLVEICQINLAVNYPYFVVGKIIIIIIIIMIMIIIIMSIYSHNNKINNNNNNNNTVIILLRSITQ